MEKEMKEQNEQKDGKKGSSLKTIIWICVAAAVLLAAVYAVIRIGGKNAGGNEIAEEGENGSMDEAVVWTGDDCETFEIPFAGLVLKYPAAWKDVATITNPDDSTLLVSVGDDPIFTLYAGEGHETLGTVLGEENTIIGVEFADINRDDSTKVAMQADVNIIIQHLSEDYDFEIGTAVIPENEDTFPIETSVTTLYYPERWKDKVAVDVSDEKVSFSAKGTPLFDLVFTECDGFLLGTYGDTPIYLVEYKVSDDEHSAMQMSVNTIISHLMEDGQFVMNG